MALFSPPLTFRPCRRKEVGKTQLLLQINSVPYQKYFIKDYTMLLDCTGTDPYGEVAGTLTQTALACSLECQQNVRSRVGDRKLSEHSPEEKKFLALKPDELSLLTIQQMQVKKYSL